MAEIPLEINIPDTRLSQINNWKIPDSIEKWDQPFNISVLGEASK